MINKNKKNLYDLISKCLDVQHIFEATKGKNEIIYFSCEHYLVTKNSANI